MNVELRKIFQFEAAHLLPHLPEDPKSSSPASATRSSAG